MSAKAIITLCVQAYLIQYAVSQCISPTAITGVPALAGPYSQAVAALIAPYALAAPGFAAPCDQASPALDYTLTSGGALPVSSASPIAPTGLFVASENVYEGALNAAGELPFVGTVVLEGVFPTAGAGAVNHGCGNGVNAMASEGAAFGPYGAAIASYGAAIITPALADPGYGYLNYIEGRGCDCTL